MAGGWRLWLRWSWRDFKRRWIQLTITALVIALGTGLFAGLSSVSRWRELSNDESFEVTRYHDLHARLGAGGFVEAGQLIEAATSGGEQFAAVEERLVVPTQVQVTAGDGEVVIVTGRLVGYDVSDGEPEVDRPYPAEGRALMAEDEGDATALIERNFGKHYNVGESGEVVLTGGHRLEFVGQAMAPEYFIVVTEESGLLAEANFGVVLTSLTTAQRVAGLEGMVNDLVIRLQPGEDAEEAAEALRARLAPLGATVAVREDEDSYRLLTEDAEGDQQVYTVLASAILAGAVFAAFNITSRMVEAQRREFGIAMALGVAPWRIAMRPLLVGAQIALLGTAFGVAVGLVIGWGIGELLRDFLVLPVITTPFQWATFAGVAALGFFAPMLAIAYPVWRAVRVPPIKAIRTGHVAVRTPGLASIAGRVPIPGDTFARMPIRNLLRAPRRALLTGAGIAAIISVLAGLLGYLDSFVDALDRAERETAADHPDRLEVDLDRFYPAESGEAHAVLESPALAGAEARIRVGATFVADDAELEVLLELTDMASPLWRPTAEAGELPHGAGLVIAEKAADDLGVGVGDTITVRHPMQGTGGELSLVETDMRVAAIHGHPIRIYAYMDLSQAAVLGLDGQLNRVTADPGPGGVSAARQELFGVPGVVSVQEAAQNPRLLRDRLDQFIGLIYVMAGSLCLLAGLIAYNTASINLDERARENATMLAYGVRPRTVIRMGIVEGFALGALSTLLGLAGGYVLARWLIDVLAPRVLPDIGLDLVLSGRSLLIVLVLGVLAVALTPLFGWRRLRRMNLPSALRLME